MRIEKLRKEDFLSDTVFRGTPSIRFSHSGVVVLTKSAVGHLKLIADKKKLHGVSFCVDKDAPCDFFIMRDDGGFDLRLNTNGQALLNSACLCRHVLEKTFEKCAHNATADAPVSYTFLIALKSVDDDKNKNVFALLRKKI
jgi:hypothetical protein